MVDSVVFIEMDGRLLAYGTPWHGDEPFASPGPARIARICFLRHASRHRLESLTRTEATARLFACSFVPFYDRAAIEFTVAFLGRIVECVPCCELEFAPDRSVLDFVRRT